MEIVSESFDDSSANIISFNQDKSLISIGTNRGYKVIQLFPVKFHENNLLGGLSRCELSYRSNLLALVGGGKIPKFNSKKVVIYNDLEDCIESEYKFATPVLNVKFKKDLIDTFDTITNKRGIIAVNGCPEKTIMAHPIEPEDDPDKGYVGIKNYKTNKYFPLLVHDEPISYMEMDYNGLILATANDKGTHIRLHNLLDKTLIYECKRGKDKAIINYISFDMDYKYIGVTSTKGTIHIWKLDELIQKEKKENNELIYSLKKNNNNSYKTELSFAKIKFQKPCIFCFKEDNIIIITQEEKYYSSKIDKKGGYFTVTELKDFYKSKKSK